MLKYAIVNKILNLLLLRIIPPSTFILRHRTKSIPKKTTLTNPGCSLLNCLRLLHSQWSLLHTLWCSLKRIYIKLRSLFLFLLTELFFQRFLPIIFIYIIVTIYNNIDYKIIDKATYSRYELFKMREIYVCLFNLHVKVLVSTTYSDGARVSMNLKATINCIIR